MRGRSPAEAGGADNEDDADADADVEEDEDALFFFVDGEGPLTLAPARISSCGVNKKGDSNWRRNVRKR